MKFIPLLLSINSLLFLSCLYRSDYPLSNSNPKCITYPYIQKELFYPDTMVCTLSVSDLNDSRLSLSVLACSSQTCDSSSDTISWPGNYSLLDENLSTKSFVLSLNTNLLDLYSGTLLCFDPCRAKVAIPFEIRKLFYESFNSSSSLDNNWVKNSRNDSTIRFDYFTEPKLQFIFSTADDGSSLSTGITSKFNLSGDFNITVDFKLRDEMTDGFEIAFFVSTSPDTGKWSGDIAGIFIRGSQGRMRLECKSIDLQSYSSEVTLYSGELGISREGSQIKYYHHDGNPQVIPPALITHDFISDDSLYVHIRMTVDDRLKYRHCLWNDFYVLKGRIAF